MCQLKMFPDFKVISKARAFTLINKYKKGTEEKNCGNCLYFFINRGYLKCSIKANNLGLNTAKSDISLKKVCKLWSIKTNG